jgi:hypothetical protein
MNEHAERCITSRMGNALISAPIRATTVKRAYGSGPVATSCRPGWADCSSGSSSQVPGSSRRAARGQAGAPAAAQRRGRASLTPVSGGRLSRPRKGFRLRVWFVRGRVPVPALGMRSGLASTHPAPRRQMRAAAMTMCPGPGLLSHVIERGLLACSCRMGERTRAWRPSRPHGRRGGVLASAGCI